MVTIIGGNVAGCSAALNIHKQHPSLPITIYETKIHNKICGGAISYPFLEYLYQKHGLILHHLHRPSQMVIGLVNGTRFSFPNQLYVIHRDELQTQLLHKCREKGIDVNMRRYSFEETQHAPDFSQYIIATGVNQLSKQIFNYPWMHSDRTWVRICRSEGYLPGDFPDINLLVFKKGWMGYGWFFKGNYQNGYNNQDGTYVNYGFGGYNQYHATTADDIENGFSEFLVTLQHYYGISLPFLHTRHHYRVPLPITHNYPFYKTINGVGYIGVGDAIGMVHPALGGGIEPAWQSGRILAQCLHDYPYAGIVSPLQYQAVLTQTINDTWQQPTDYRYQKLSRSQWLPHRLIPNRLMLAMLKRAFHCYFTKNEHQKIVFF